MIKYFACNIHLIFLIYLSPLNFPKKLFGNQAMNINQINIISKNTLKTSAGFLFCFRNNKTKQGFGFLCNICS